jgi:hypothetical protein
VEEADVFLEQKEVSETGLAAQRKVMSKRHRKQIMWIPQVRG